MRPKSLRQLTDRELDDQHASTAAALRSYSRTNQIDPADAAWVEAQRAALNRQLRLLRTESIRRYNRTHTRHT